MLMEIGERSIMLLRAGWIICGVLAVLFLAATVYLYIHYEIREIRRLRKGRRIMRKKHRGIAILLAVLLSVAAVNESRAAEAAVEPVESADLSRETIEKESVAAGKPGAEEQLNAEGQLDTNEQSVSAGEPVELLDVTAPVITEGKVDAAAVEIKGVRYFRDSLTLEFSVVDEESGIERTWFTIGGEAYPGTQIRLSEDLHGGGDQMTETGQAAEADQQVTVTFSAIDKSGNTAEVQLLVCRDAQAPTIERIDYAGYRNYLQWDTEYGYFFDENVEITICAGDGNGCGIARTLYYLEGQLYDPGEKLWKDVRPDVQEAVENRILVEQGFRGYLYVCAEDYLGQRGEWVKGSFTCRGDQTIHLDHYEVSADGLPEAPAVSAEGEPLYGEEGFTISNIQVRNRFAGLDHAIVGTKEQVLPEMALQEVMLRETGSKGEETEDSLCTAMAGAYTITGAELGEVEYSGVTLQVRSQCNLLHTEDVETIGRFSIDTQAPRVAEITFDNYDVRNECYYKEIRTATIRVTDRNFDTASCPVITGPAVTKSDWSRTPGTDEYVMTVAFTADGEYTLQFTARDLLGHTADAPAVERFVIDRTAPVIRVSYDNNDVRNGIYYRNSRRAAITIVERNFREQEAELQGTASDQGKAIAMPEIVGWYTSGEVRTMGEVRTIGDTHTAVIDFARDGMYSWSLTCTDLAGNEAVPYESEGFVIDLTDPEIRFYDIVNHSANRGTVAPGVRCLDTNRDASAVVIGIAGVRTGQYDWHGDAEVSGSCVDWKLQNFAEEPEMDDLYTMQVSVSDLAGRSSSAEVVFSVNRYGSVYLLDPQIEKFLKTNDGFTNREQEILVREINVDLIEESRIAVSRDGETRILEKADYSCTLAGDETSWKEYTYCLPASLFAEDGSYEVLLYSRDRAENTMDNRNNLHQKECRIGFVVDKTAPITVVTDLENNGHYRTDSREIHIVAEDAYRLASVVVETNRERTVLQPESGDHCELRYLLGSSPDWQTVRVYSVDKAGNTDRESCASVRVLVTSSLWSQWIHTPWIVGLLLFAAVSGVGVLMWLFLRLRSAA